MQWCPGWAEKVFPYCVSNMVPPAWLPYSSLCCFCLSSTEDDEDEEEIVHMGNAIMSFYSALIDLLGRCAPEMHVSDEFPEGSFEGLESGTWWISWRSFLLLSLACVNMPFSLFLLAKIKSGFCLWYLVLQLSKKWLLGKSLCCMIYLWP